MNVKKYSAIFISTTLSFGASATYANSYTFGQIIDAPLPSVHILTDQEQAKYQGAVPPIVPGMIAGALTGALAHRYTTDSPSILGTAVSAAGGAIAGALPGAGAGPTLTAIGQSVVGVSTAVTAHNIDRDRPAPISIPAGRSLM